MAKGVITLYVNDPMGKRWEQNLEAARRAEQELAMKVVVIAKTSEQYLSEKSPPPCPSVKLDSFFLIKDGTISFHDISTVVWRNDCDVGR